MKSSDTEKVEFLIGLTNHIIDNTLLSIADLNLELVSEIKDPENDSNRIHDHIEKLKRKYDIIDRTLLSLNKFRNNGA